MPKGTRRLPIASGEAPAPTITIADDDWKRIEQAYGASLSPGVRSEVLSAPEAISEDYQWTTEPVPKSEKLIRAYKKPAKNLWSAILTESTSDAGAYAQALVERHFQGMKPDGSTRLFDALLSLLASFHGACDAALNELRLTQPSFDMGWKIWVRRLAKILESHDLSTSVRKDGERASSFVAFVRELQSFLPDKCKCPYADSALSTAIRRALRVK